MKIDRLVQALSKAGVDVRLRISETAREDIDILDVVYDSRRVGPGALFVALKGAAFDGHRFVQGALEAGACAAMVEEGFEAAGLEGAPLIYVPDTRNALAYAASAFFEHPDRELSVVGITGTNAKTTTTYLLEAMGVAAGMRVGVIGTVNIRFGEVVRSTRNTTPESLELYRLLREMVEAGVELVFLEVSSHALRTHRVIGVSFEAAMFTNFSQDHLDFHSSMEDYLEAKSLLFTEHLPRSVRRHPKALINVADPRLRRLAESIDDDRVDVITYATAGDGAECAVEDVSLDVGGIEARLVSTRFGELCFSTSLVGRLNLENVLGAASCALALGMEPANVLDGLAALEGIPGRLEAVSGSAAGPSVFVDYAHTPEAVALAGTSLREVTNGRLVVVLGCGGDRDASKRHPMGVAAAEVADVVVATSDNPRTEDPEAILDALIEGVVEGGAPPLAAGVAAGYARVTSRRAAIAAAIGLARLEDTVLIAGKGHESYQEIGGVRYPMSDVEEARRSLSHSAGRCVVETIPLHDLADACGATLITTLAPAMCDANAGVVTDSRAVGEGAIFVALRGERFDAHDFLEDVVGAGALAIVVEDLDAAQAAWLAAGRQGATLVVEDTLTALGEMARHTLEVARALRPALVTVGLTGSNGKTTTKEVLASLLIHGLGFSEDEVHKTPGNYNNFIGVPLTVFQLRQRHAVAVLEMGTNAFGEIARLVEIARPDVRMLTSVGGAHLEGFGTIEGVLKAKSEIFSGPGSAAIAPLSCIAGLVSLGALQKEDVRVFAPERVHEGVEKVDASLEVFGLDVSLISCTVGSREISSSRFEDLVGRENASEFIAAGSGRDTIRLADRIGRRLHHVRYPLLGEHNVANLACAFEALVAVATLLERDVPERMDLSSLTLPRGRLRAVEGRGAFGGVMVLDDCYNANPASMAAGLLVLEELAAARGGRAVAVLGDMFEMGSGSEAGHAETLALALERADLVVGFGAAFAQVISAVDRDDEARLLSVSGHDEDAVASIRSWLSRRVTRGDVVLVKGSRGMRMERLVAVLVSSSGETSRQKGEPQGGG